MALRLRVVTDPELCRADGRGRFTISTTAGRAMLPALEIAPLPGRAAPTLLSLQPMLLTGSGGLADAVLAGWQSAGWRAGPITAPVRLPSVPIQVPAVADRDVVISWLGRYALELDETEEFEAIVDLHFAADPSEAPAVRADDDQRHSGFLAIDFGTSNCTAVLYDDEHLTMRALDPAQLNRLRADLIALLTGAPPAGTADQLTGLLQRVARAIAPQADLTDPAGVLLGTLRNEAVAEAGRDITAYREPALTYLVLLRLEREVDSCTDPLRTWLRTTLHECYDAAFDVPRLESLQLFPVELDAQAASVELRSRVIVPASGALDEAVMPTDDSPPEAGARVYSGLKARIGQADRRPAGDDNAPDVDTLVGAGLRYMVKQSDAFIASNPKRFGNGRTGRVVATYPTIAPPIVRQKLHELLTGPDGPQMRQVVTAYDEAVAAAMFFLMREFSGQLEIGVEAAKSRYQRVPDKDRAWKQNVLVIDIGGGTTDIALLTMVLTDRTPPEAARTPWAGRYYEVTPTVRGTTGFLQLGGEYLTLRVFRWLKAEIVDLLLSLDPEHYQTEIRSLLPKYRDDQSRYRPRSLVERILARDDDTDVLDFLESVIPTRWGVTAANEQAFWLLWTMAEAAKLALAQPGAVAHPVTAAQIRQVVNATATTRAAGPPHLDNLTEDRIVLDADRFAGLLDESLTAVMQRATNLVLGALKRGSERLDRIILTGKSTAMPHVRHALTTHFGKRSGSDETVDWEPSSIEVLEEYSKLATGIGAAWAQSIIWYRRTPEGAMRQLAEGKTHFDIKIENLFATLPATFGLVEQNGQFGVRLRAGTKLLQLDAEPVAKARSDFWEQLTENVAVRRELEQGFPSPWASLNVADRAGDEGIESSGGVWPHRIHSMLEIDQNTEVSVLLCRGTPHYLVDAPAIDLADAIRSVYGPDALNPDGTLPTRLPGDVLVDSKIAGSSTLDDHAVFRADEELVFDELFLDRDHPSALTCAGTGAVRTRTLEPPRPGLDGSQGSWTFSLRHGGAGEKKIGTLPCPVIGTGQLATRYLVTLDVTGKLRVHAGAVPFQQAATMREVEESPGRVLREKLPSAPPEYNEKRDPFNGTH